MPPYRSDRWHGHMPSSAGTLRSVSVLTHLSGGDPAGLVGVSLTICQVGRLGRKKEEGTTLIPILPFVVLGNHWSPGKVTWANPRLGKVTLNRARLHLSKSTAWPRSRRYSSEKLNLKSKVLSADDFCPKPYFEGSRHSVWLK